MKRSTKLWIFAAILAVLCGTYVITTHCCEDSCKDSCKTALLPTDDSSQFVTLTTAVPDAILEIRYFGTYNFVGTRIDGYLQPTALLTR